MSRTLTWWSAYDNTKLILLSITSRSDNWKKEKRNCFCRKKLHFQFCPQKETLRMELTELRFFNVLTKWRSIVVSFRSPGLIVLPIFSWKTSDLRLKLVILNDVNLVSLHSSVFPLVTDSTNCKKWIKRI